MIDKGQWWEFGQDAGVTALLFTKSTMGFLMTTESQDLGFNVSSERCDMRLLSFEKVSPEIFCYLMHFSLQIVLST